MKNSFDLFSFITPFGISEIFEAIGYYMNFNLKTTVEITQNDENSILCACSSNNNESHIWERWHKSGNNVHCITETKIEHQRFALFKNRWRKPFLPGDPTVYTDITRRIKWQEHELEERWEWITDWSPVVIANSTDSDGWMYAKNFVGWNKWKEKKGVSDMVRIRYLVRRREFREEGEEQFIGKEFKMEAMGCNLIHKIQYGMKVALLKNKRVKDYSNRTYFFLSDTENNLYQFQDYEASLFKQIRNLYGVDESKYIDAMCNETLLGGDKNEAGKSGQIFWRSFNNEFVIKTINHQEASFLTKILPKYVNYLKENRHSLISRIFGLHKLKISNKRIRFVVMNNVFSTCKMPTQLIYDLKGTTEDRLVKQSSKSKIQPVLKDLNFADRFILVSGRMVENLLTQIEKDAKFLMGLSVMDYSLLLGVSISDADKSNPKLMEDPALVESDCALSSPLKSNRDNLSHYYISKSSIFENGIKGPLAETYYVGIIDIFQNWTRKKRLANAFKTVVFFDYHQRKIDSVSPPVYCKRFIQYFKEKVNDIKSFGPPSVEVDELDYRFLVKCNSASDLPQTDLFGLSGCSPYVVIQCDTQQSVTSVVKGNCNPVWGHFCSFPVSRKNVPKFITFTVFDYEMGFKPGFLGAAVLDTKLFFTDNLLRKNLDLCSREKIENIMAPRMSFKKKKPKEGEGRKIEGALDVSIELIVYNNNSRHDNIGGNIVEI